MNIVLKVALKHRLDYLIARIANNGRFSKKEKEEAELLAKLEQFYENK